MTLRLGLTADIDLASLCFPWEAGWVMPPAGIVASFKPLADLERALLDGELDVAPVSLLTYVTNQATLQVLPTPVRASEMATDSVFLISLKRLDQLERVRVAVSPTSSTGEALLKILAPTYYGIVPETWVAPSEAAALEALQGNSEICILTGESAMRSVGWAKAKGYFVEDLTKAWWIMTGTPLPLYLFAVRQEWTRHEPDATGLVRSLMLSFRRAVQVSLEQRPTLLAQAEARTGLPAAALDAHFRSQRYELNEAHLRGLLEFYRRATAANLAPPLADLVFFPSLAPVAPAPAGPLRRSQPEAERPRPAPARSRNGVDADQANEETPPRKPARTAKSPSRRSEAQAKGLRVIKGGKDRSNRYEGDDDNDK